MFFCNKHFKSCDDMVFPEIFMLHVTVELNFWIIMLHTLWKFSYSSVDARLLPVSLMTTNTWLYRFHVWDIKYMVLLIISIADKLMKLFRITGNPAIVALFVVETMPSFFFAPCGLIDGAANFGPATILSFFPKFQYGSLLIVVSLKLWWTLWKRQVNYFELHQNNWKSWWSISIDIKQGKTNLPRISRNLSFFPWSDYSDDPGRTRTCSLRFRRATPYPLGHRADCWSC